MPTRLNDAEQTAEKLVTHLREGAVVPDVTVVGEAVADVTQTALLNVLLDGVEGLLLGDLHFRVGPARDLDDHVQDAIVLVGEERDVVEGRNDGPVGCLLDEDTVFCTAMSNRDLLCCQIDLPSVLAAPIWRVVYAGCRTVSTASKATRPTSTDRWPWSRRCGDGGSGGRAVGGRL